MFTTALLMALVGALHFSVRKNPDDKFIGGMLLQAVVTLMATTIVSSMFVYFARPAITGPFGGPALLGGMLLVFLANLAVQVMPRPYIATGVVSLMLALGMLIWSGSPLAPLMWAIFVLSAVVLFVDQKTQTLLSLHWEERNGFRWTVPAVGFVLTLLIFFFWGLGTMDRWHLDTKAKMLAEVTEHDIDEWEQGIQPDDEQRIRWVAYSTLQYKAGRKMTSQDLPEATGSTFRPGVVNVQEYKGETVGVCPLDYNGFFKWKSGLASPAYLVFSTENPNHEGDVVTQIDGKPLEMRYMPGAPYEFNLHRHIYSQYPNAHLLDRTFELEEPSGKPWWVISAAQPTATWGAKKVVFLILVDPQSGEIKEVGLDELQQYPWIDRVLPEKLALLALDWWGKYEKPGVDGGHSRWTNGWLGKTGVVTPTALGGRSDLTLIPGPNGSTSWYTGFTSASTTDATLVSFGLVNARTQRADIYRFEGRTEESAISLVKSSIPKMSGEVGPANQAIPHNIDGTVVYVVPVIQTEGKNLGAPKGYAITPVRGNEFVAFGETPRECLQEFRLRLAGQRKDAPDAVKQASLNTVSGNVLRVATFGDGQRGLTVSGWPQAFVGFPSTSPDMVELGYSQPGDAVTLFVTDTKQPVIQIRMIDNHALEMFDADDVEQ